MDILDEITQLVDGGLSDPDAAPTNTPPTIGGGIDPYVGTVPFTATLDGSGSFDDDGQIVRYTWTLGDGRRFDTAVANVRFTEDDINNGDSRTMDVQLEIEDDDGATSSTSGLNITLKSGGGSPPPDPPDPEPPTARISVSDEEVRPPATVTFDGSGSSDPDGSIQSYRWEFRDVPDKRGATVTRRFTNDDAGSVPTKLTVTDTDGKTDEAFADVQVIRTNRPPDADLSISDDEVVAPATITFDASGSSDPDGQVVSYEWSFSDGETRQGNTVRRRFTEADVGRVGVDLTVTDDDGATGGAFRGVDIKEPVNNPPTANVSVSPSAGTVPFRAVFDASASSDPDGDIQSYQWEFSDGNSRVGKRVSRQFDSGDIGTVTGTCTVTGNEGKTDSASTSVEVKPQPNKPPNAVVTTRVSNTRR